QRRTSGVHGLGDQRRASSGAPDETYATRSHADDLERAFIPRSRRELHAARCPEESAVGRDALGPDIKVARAVVEPRDDRAPETVGSDRWQRKMVIDVNAVRHPESIPAPVEALPVDSGGLKLESRVLPYRLDASRTIGGHARPGLRG